MRALLVSIILIAAMGVNSAQFAPWYPMYPIITFYDDGKDYTTSDIPRTCEQVGINFSNTQSKTIIDLVVRGDSLIISTKRDTNLIILLAQGSDMVVSPIYLGSTITFDKAGLYQAFENDTEVDCLHGQSLDCGITALGTFRVFPLIQTDPLLPVTSKPTTLTLVMGQMHSYCFPTYITSGSSVILSGNDIHLSYSELPPGPCIEIYVDPPVKYGPEFSLGSLAAGTYNIYLEDSLLVGNITVEDPLVLQGSVNKMKHPYTYEALQPVEGVAIVAEIYDPCGFYASSGISGIVCSTITDKNGAFTLELPRKSYDYDIAASLAGYYDQVISKPASDAANKNISFWLLPDTGDSLTSLDVTVTLDGTPAESIQVTIAGGHGMVLCPAYTAKAAGYYNGLTDANGELSLKDISLKPYIDYVYTAYRYSSSGSLNESGDIRLYKAGGFVNQLAINFTSNRITDPIIHQGTKPQFTISPHPVRSGAVINFSLPGENPEISIYDMSGRAVRTFTRPEFMVKGLENGVYLIRARGNGFDYSEKLLINK